MNREISKSMRERSKHVGAWLNIGSPVIAELAASFPFHWILFDLEHGCGTEATLLSNLQAAKGNKTALIVRPGQYDPALISRILDWGASGIMMPHVNSATQAEQCLQAMRYPPHGKRGFSSSARMYNFGVDQSPFGQFYEQPLFFAQIETEEGVNNAADIAKVEGVDVLFIGPADLKWDLTANGNMVDGKFDTAVKQVVDAGLTNGKQVGILAKSPDEVEKYFNLGITCIGYASDLLFLRQAFQHACDTFISNR